MKTLEKLHRIEKEKSIYDIHYCRAGVGFVFYEPPNGHDINKRFNDSINRDYWRKYLKVDKYYPTFTKAVNAEYRNLKS